MSIVRNLGGKLSTFRAGLAIKKTLDYGFDYGLYPLALLWLGYWQGGLVMTAASVVLNLAVIRAYDWSKRDWLLLESLKRLKERSNAAGASGLVGRVIAKGDVPAFLILSWIEDPIVVTLYLRKGADRFNGLARRDWAIFWASTFASNLFWILSLISIFEVVGGLFA